VVIAVIGGWIDVPNRDEQYKISIFIPEQGTNKPEILQLHINLSQSSIDGNPDKNPGRRR